MGKIRKAIEELTIELGVLEKDIEELLERRSTVKQNYKIQADFCASGCDVIVMYLTEKFKKANETIDQHAKDTIKDILDANVAKSIKEIATASANLAKARKEAETWDKDRDDLLARLKDFKTSLKALNASIEKRKKKLLVSKKYKTKLKAYESVLDELNEKTDELMKDFSKKIVSKFSNPDLYKFSTTTTVEDIQQGSTTDLNADFLMTPQEDAAQAAKYRGRHFAKQLTVLKDWSDEADEMEAESDE